MKRNEAVAQKIVNKMELSALMFEEREAWQRWNRQLNSLIQITNESTPGFETSALLIHRLLSLGTVVWASCSIAFDEAKRFEHLLLSTSLLLSYRSAWPCSSARSQCSHIVSCSSSGAHLTARPRPRTTSASQSVAQSTPLTRFQPSKQPDHLQQHTQYRCASQTRTQRSTLPHIFV